MMEIGAGGSGKSTILKVISHLCINVANEGVVCERPSSARRIFICRTTNLACRHLLKCRQRHETGRHGHGGIRDRSGE
jgi:ABC-type cobalamin/Fe3+-siderophores transport system ATPase subunit